MEISKEEKAEQQATIIKIIQANLQLLDVEFLKSSLVDMQEMQNIRGAKMAAFSIPFTTPQRHELFGSQIKQLELFISLAENWHVIIENSKALAEAQKKEAEIKNDLDLLNM